MPRTLLDEQGNKFEVPDETELSALQETAKKAAEYEAKLKEVEQEVNPNWRKTRETLKERESTIEKLQAELEKAGVKSSEQRAMSPEEYTTIAAQQARNVLLEQHKDNVLSQFGNQRSSVEEIYNSLAHGKQLDNQKIEELAGIAARAVGIEAPRAGIQRSFAGGGSSAPRFSEDVERTNFADTDAGKAAAAAFGIEIGPAPTK